MRPWRLLWRTVLLLVVWLIGVQIAAFQLFRVSEREPRAREIAQQLVSMVNLTRAVRLENARSNLSGFFGLGLAILDRIALMHDGRLHLLARAGDGLEARVSWLVGVG
jgi:hypothetical protein